MDDSTTRNGLSRRQALTLMGAAGAVSVVGLAARAWAACDITPAQTEGPYWVDERLNRSDIRIDPSNGAVSSGVPLTLVINVLRADNDCAPAEGAQVDVWHCDAGGLYSDEAANDTVGMKFLRGYQTTDANGTVRFTTVYPGWYRGRTVHIHFRVRTFNGSTETSNFASQLYFDEATSDQVLGQPPYNTRGTRDTRNSNDNIFDDATLLTLVSDDDGGYIGTFDVARNGLPIVASPTPGATATATPPVTPTSCDGDCDASGDVTVDELVTGVNMALDGTSTDTCALLDTDGSGAVTVDEIVKAVNAALNGC